MKIYRDMHLETITQRTKSQTPETYTIEVYKCDGITCNNHMEQGIDPIYEDPQDSCHYCECCARELKETLNLKLEEI